MWRGNFQFLKPPHTRATSYRRIILILSSAYTSFPWVNLSYKIFFGPWIDRWILSLPLAKSTHPRRVILTRVYDSPSHYEQHTFTKYPSASLYCLLLRSSSRFWSFVLGNRTNNSLYMLWHALNVHTLSLSLWIYPTGIYFYCSNPYTQIPNYFPVKWATKSTFLLLLF